MFSYVTGLLVAGGVVASLLGLLTLTQDQPTHEIYQAIAKLEPPELRKRASDPQAANRLDAILQLGEKPGELGETVPLLAKLTMDEQELARSAAELALQKIGAAGAPFVRAMLESDDENQCSAAATAVKELGDGAKLYLPLFKEWLESNDPLNRRRALYALQGAGKEGLPLMDLLIEALDDPDFNNQCMACRVLENLGPDAMPAEDALLKLLNEGNPSARSWASIVLGAIGPTDRTDVSNVLGSKLELPLQIDKQRALLGIAHLGAEASSLEVQVRALVNDESKHVQPHAAFALWRITGDAKESVATLKKLIHDPSYSNDAIELAGKMQAEAAPLVQALAKHLASDEESNRELAVVALGNIGPAASAAKPHIKKLLGDKDPLIRYAAREALKQIDGP